MTATDCLASTGTDTLLPFMLIAGVLLVAGVIAVFAAKRRAGWAALLILPLLLGGAFLGAGAPSAQAAGVACEQAAAPGGTDVILPPLPAETPTPEPACTPVAALADVAIDASNWQFRDDDGFNGYYVMLSQTDSDAIAAVIAESTSDNPVVTLTVHGTDFSGQEPVPGEASISAPIGYSGVGDFFRVSTAESFVYLPSQLIEKAVADEIGDPNSFSVEGLQASIAVPYSDGCGGTATAHITLEMEFPVG